MENCRYIVKINDQIIYETASDEDLDSFIYANRDSLMQNINSLDIISELSDPLKRTLNIVKNSDSTAIVVDKTKRVPVTQLWGKVNPRTLAEKDSYEEYCVKRLKTERNISEEEAKKIFKEEEKDNQITKMGSAFHKILENKIKGLPLGKDSESGFNLNSSDFEKERNIADYFLRELSRKFGKRGEDYELLTEQSIATSQIDSNLLPVFRTILGGKDFTHIIGKADLVLITKNGDIHIFDYKTSHHNLGKNWYESNYDIIKQENSYPQYKRDEYEAQVMSYVAMYTQKKIPNVYGHLACFHRNEDSNHIDLFQGIVDFQNTSRIKSKVDGVFGISLEVGQDDVEKTNNDMIGCFGSDASVAKKSKGFVQNVEFYLNSKDFLRDVDKNSDEFKKFGYIKYFRDSIDNNLVYCKSMQDAREKITNYVEKLNKNADKVLMNIGRDLASNIRNIQQLEDFAQNLSMRNKTTIVRTFEKYITQHWLYKGNDELAGNGIFLFEKGDRCEIVMMDTAEGLHKRVELNRGTSILGDILRDNEYGVDKRFHLDASIGNMLLMKAVSFMSNHADYFKTKKVSRIIAFNPIFGDSYTTTPLSVLAYNWQTLAYLRPKLKLRLIDDLIFNDGEACVRTAQDYIMGMNNYNTNIKLFKLAKEDVDYNENQIREMLKSLELIEKNLTVADPKIKLAYGELYKALLYLRGQYRICVEPNVEEFLNKGIVFTGGYFTPLAISPSANLRTVNELSIIFHNKVANEAHKIIIEWQKLLNKAFRNKIHTIIGGQWTLFNEWFEKDNSGEIKSDFILKDPLSDSYFINHPDEAEACKYFLNTLAELRWGKDWESRVGTPEYFQVPLCEPLKDLEILENSKGFSGVDKVLRKKAEAIQNITTEIINGKRVEIGKYAKETDLDIDQVYNPYFDQSYSERMELLQDKHKGPAFFEQNLDVVFLNTVVTSLKSNFSKEFLPLFTGIRVLLSIENEFNRANMQNILSTINDYVGSVVLNRSLVPDSLQIINKVLSAFRGLTSKLTLGLSAKAFTRETISSFVRTGFAAAIKDPKFIGTDDEFSDGFDIETYIDALFYNLTHIKEAFTSDSKDMQLNTMFRAANMSYHEIANNLQTGKYGLKNITGDFWFLTSTTPDFLHRIAVLKATLQKIGAYDAYIMEDGVLKYDWTKDKRFGLLFKYADNNVPKQSDVNKISDINEIREWNKQSEYYKLTLERWKKYGEDLKYGDALPEALDPIQQNNFKTRTDILFGNYDNESKALIQRTLLGGMFFQYKTYGISRLIEWWRNNGAINIIQPHNIKDENGKQLYEYLSTEEEILAGEPYKKIKNEDEITEEDLKQNRVRPLVDSIGIPNEGRIQSCWAMAAAIVTNDHEAIKEIWEDKFKRANLLAAIHDTWIMVLISGLVRLIYGDDVIETMNEQDWWTRWTHAVLMGVAQDGPVWDVAKSVWGNGEIPSMQALSKYFTTAMSVINGNTYVLTGFVNSFGATKELSAMIDQI